MDKINDRFGSMAVTFGSLIKEKESAGKSCDTAKLAAGWDQER